MLNCVTTWRDSCVVPVDFPVAFTLFGEPSNSLSSLGIVANSTNVLIRPIQLIPFNLCPLHLTAVIFQIELLGIASLSRPKGSLIAQSTRLWL